MNALQPGWLAGNGRYTLVRLLGNGDAGTVWLAKDEQLQEEVALKFLPPAIGLNGAALDDLKRETLRARKLTHSNIVRIHDFFQGAHEAVISMEFVDGANLETLRLEKPNKVFAWKDLYPLVLQLCDALDYAHKEGVIHGNLKPDYLMIDGKGKLKLAGFGFSIPSTDVPEDLAQRNAANSYRSSGRLAGEPLCAADDIYALGATLYELLTGTPLFNGDEIGNRLPAQMAVRLAERGIQNEIPEPVNALVVACIAKDPLRRPRSAALIGEVLRTPESKSTAVIEEVAAAQEVESDALSDHPNPTSTSSQASVGTKPISPIIVPPIPNWPQSEAQPTPKPSRGRSSLIVVMLAGLILLAVAGFLGWKQFQKHAENQQSVDSGVMEGDSTNTESVESGEMEEQQPNSPAATPTQGVKYETAALVISGNGFGSMDFDERVRAFTDRKYAWRQTPSKFRGWNFTQVAHDKRPYIHVRAKQDTDVYVAAGFLNTTKPAELVFPGWQSDGSVFYYTPQSHEVVFRKHLEAGQETDIPQGRRFAVFLLFPNPILATGPAGQEETGAASLVKFETTDIVVSGKEFSVDTFNEGSRTFANHKYTWQQTPPKFRGWSYTQLREGTRAEIHVRAKSNTTVFVAIEPSSSPKESLFGWESDNSFFSFTDPDKTRMAVYRKRLDAGQELDVPQSGRAGVMVLFLK